VSPYARPVRRLTTRNDVENDERRNDDAEESGVRGAVGKHQDKALDFYTNVIGLEKRGDYPTPAGPRFLTVGVEGQDFDLVLWPGTPARGDAGSAVYTIEVEDCRIAFETLKSRGVRFEPPEILEFPWGYAARFQDPDGNLLQVREGRGVFRR